MIMLAQLYQDLEAQVIQQEPAVAQIEQRGEEVNDNVAKVSFLADLSQNHPSLTDPSSGQYRARRSRGQGSCSA